jgi:hypothetical protein
MSEFFIIMFNYVNGFLKKPSLDFKVLIDVNEFKRELDKEVQVIRQSHSSTGSGGAAYLSTLHTHFLQHLKNLILAIYKSAQNKAHMKKLKISASSLRECAQEATEFFIEKYKETMQLYNIGGCIRSLPNDDEFSKIQNTFLGAANHLIEDQIAERDREYQDETKKNKLILSRWCIGCTAAVIGCLAKFEEISDFFLSFFV